MLAILLILRRSFQQCQLMFVLLRICSISKFRITVIKEKFHASGFHLEKIVRTASQQSAFRWYMKVLSFEWSRLRISPTGSTFSPPLFRTAPKESTVKPLSYGHRMDDWTKYPYYGGVRIMEVEFVWNLVSFAQSELSVIDRCPYYGGVRIKEVEFVWKVVSFGPCGLYVIERCPYHRGVRKERFDCTSQ